MYFQKCLICIYICLDVEFPERSKLKFMDKVPLIHGNIRPPKMTKSLKFMRGPEQVHNFLLHQQFGIIVSMITFNNIFRVVYCYLSCYICMAKCGACRIKINNDYNSSNNNNNNNHNIKNNNRNKNRNLQKKEIIRNIVIKLTECSARF